MLLIMVEYKGIITCAALVIADTWAIKRACGKGNLEGWPSKPRRRDGMFGVATFLKGLESEEFEFLAILCRNLPS
jgi:hypothetical protein